MDYVKTNLSPQEKQQLDLFNLLLEYHGWEDLQQIEWRLDHGQKVPVLGMRTYRSSQGYLEARFHAGIAMISIDISTGGSPARLHCAFGHNPLPLLEFITQQADNLLAELDASLGPLSDTCLEVLQENEDHQITRLRLSSLR
ncbi:MAG: hypothetical protein D6722_09645 [Bacteroidetes bacterium]|nr:MAG: hypothetical protein D6722_09645 [Bacteroidota bacterium]